MGWGEPGLDDFGEVKEPLYPLVPHLKMGPLRGPEEESVNFSACFREGQSDCLGKAQGTVERTQGPEPGAGPRSLPHWPAVGKWGHLLPPLLQPQFTMRSTLPGDNWELPAGLQVEHRSEDILFSVEKRHGLGVCVLTGQMCR